MNYETIGSFVSSSSGIFPTLGTDYMRNLLIWSTGRFFYVNSFFISFNFYMIIYSVNFSSSLISNSDWLNGSTLGKFSLIYLLILVKSKIVFYFFKDFICSSFLINNNSLNSFSSSIFNSSVLNAN